MSGKVKRQRDRAGEHRWNVTARNGRIVGHGGEGYKTRRAADAGAVVVALAILQDPVLGPKVRKAAGIVSFPPA